MKIVKTFEYNEETGPSILSVTHQMSHKKIQLAQLRYEMVNYKVITVGT